MGYRAPTLLLPLHSCRCHFIAKYGSSGSGFMTGLKIICAPLTAKVRTPEIQFAPAYVFILSAGRKARKEPGNCDNFARHGVNRFNRLFATQ
jgi:hypothetical protein